MLCIKAGINMPFETLCFSKQTYRRELIVRHPREIFHSAPLSSELHNGIYPAATARVARLMGRTGRTYCRFDDMMVAVKGL